MTVQWIGPNNGDGQIIDFGLSKSEIEQRRDETRRASDQLQVLAELSIHHISDVCTSVDVDASRLRLAIDNLRKEADLLILQLERYW